MFHRKANRIGVLPVRNRFLLCYFETTRKCNLSCPYCMTRRTPETFEGELSTEEAKRLVLDEVRKYTSKGCVAFSGGEFLLRPDAIPLLEYNTAIGQWSFVNTNGTLLDDRLLRDIQVATQRRIVLVFSLDALVASEDVVTREGSIDQIAEKTRLCSELGVPYFYVVTISRANMGKLEHILDFATRDNRPVLRSPFVPRGAGADHRSLMFDKWDMQHFIHPALRANWLSYISFVPFLAAPTFFSRHWIKSSIAIKHLGCQAGRSYVGISAEGDVAPCVHLLDTDATCGNVRETPLSDILRNSVLLDRLRSRKSLEGQCGKCKYRNTCGGCRAVAYHTHGDVMGEDPTCFLDSLDEGTRKDLERMQNENLAKFADFIHSTPPWNQVF